MRRTREVDGDEDGLTSLMMDFTVKLYVGHIHAGRACISLEQAVALAAAVIGAAQSPDIYRMVDWAKNDPVAALAMVEQKQAAFSDAVDGSRRRQAADWAEALKSGESH